LPISKEFREVVDFADFFLLHAQKNVIASWQ